jgi:hypothetical protein
MTEIEAGLCQCGCRGRTKIAAMTSRRDGDIKGEPRRYIHGHNGRKMSDRERFEQYVYPDPNSGCFIWAGSWNEKGYGQFILGGKRLKVHRAAWVLSGRVLPETPLLHKCDTPCCVNPDHLFPGSVSMNNIDMARKGRGRKSLAGLPYGVARNHKRFMAQVTTHYLGTYDTSEEAHAVAKKFKDALFGGHADP